MEKMANDLLIGAAGSVIGAGIVFLFTYGIRITTATRLTAKQSLRQEMEKWKNSGLLPRQEITNYYLIGILKHFIVGTSLITMASIFADLTPVVPQILNLCGLFFFYSALGKILRYEKLKKHSPDISAEIAAQRNSELKPQGNNK
jgi:hypothetical protein